MTHYIKKVSLAVMVGVIALSVPSVFAQQADSPISSFDDIIGLFEKVAIWLFRLFFVIAVMYIIFAAFTFLRAGDDAGKVEKAKKMLINAVIAIVIALVSSGVAGIINSFIE